MSEDTISSVLTLGDLEPLNIFDEETQQWVLNPVYDLDFSIVIDEPSTNHGIPEFDELIAYCKQMGRGMSSGEIKQFLIDESNKHNCNLSFNYVGVSHPLIRKLVIFILKYRHAELNQLNSKGNLMKISQDSNKDQVVNNLLIINTSKKFWDNKLKNRIISNIEGQEVVNLVGLLEYQLAHFDKTFLAIDSITNKWELSAESMFLLKTGYGDDAEAYSYMEPAHKVVVDQWQVLNELMAVSGFDIDSFISYVNSFIGEYNGDLSTLMEKEDEQVVGRINAVIKLLQSFKDRDLVSTFGTADREEFISLSLQCKTQQLNEKGCWTHHYEKTNDVVNGSPCKIGYNETTGEYVIQFYTISTADSQLGGWILELANCNNESLVRVITQTVRGCMCVYPKQLGGLTAYNVSDSVWNHYHNISLNGKSVIEEDVDKYGISDELKALCVDKPVDSVDHWFKVATDYPSAAKFISQLKVHYEEVNEGTTALKNLMELAGVETINELFTEEHINDERLETQWIELIDAFGDQMVTAIGSMRYLGVDPARVLSSIAASNLSKFEDDKPVRLEEHGKILKGKFYTKVDLVWVLTEMREHFKGWVYNETDKPLTLDNLLIETGSN